MIDWLVIACLAIGSFFMCIAGVGVVRLPDIYLRMSATTKAATFGVGFILLAAALYFEDFGVTMRALAAIFFLFLTAPVAAHIIGRAAYINNIPLWKGTGKDELKGRYHGKAHELTSSQEQADARSAERKGASEKKEKADREES